MSAAVTASELTEDMEYEFHDLVENYNDLFSHVYDFAFRRAEDQAEGLAVKAMDQVRRFDSTASEQYSFGFIWQDRFRFFNAQHNCHS